MILTVSRAFADPSRAPEDAARLAMDGRRAALEWTAGAIRDGQRLDPLLYPPEAGLQRARSDHFDGLPGFLADGLPDAWGLRLMARRLARQGRRLSDLNGLEKLALVGSSGRGALAYHPADEVALAVGALDLDRAAADAFALLTGTDGDSSVLERAGSGSGGARPKAHVWLSPTGEARLEPFAGAAEWIVKFRGPTDPDDIGPLEAAYAAMAVAAGLDMAPVRLLPAKAGPARFATQRFDRTPPNPQGSQARPGVAADAARPRSEAAQRRQREREDSGRIHMLTLCGALEAPPGETALGYEQLLRATRAITRNEADVAAAFARCVFNVLAHNRDDHARQHAFLMDDAGVWRLSPAYDLTLSDGPGGEHELDILGEARTISGAAVRRLGALHGLKPAAIEAIIDRTRAAIADWPAFARAAGVSTASQAAAARGHARAFTDFSDG